MMIVSIEADKIAEIRFYKSMRGTLLDGERPDFVVLEASEAEKALSEQEGLNYIEKDIVPSLRKPSWNNVLVRKDDELIKFERY